MTKEEALKMLDETPLKISTKPSKVNPSLTCAQGVEIIRKALVEWPEGKELDHLFHKRVMQVTKNQRRPGMTGAPERRRKW